MAVQFEDIVDCLKILRPEFDLVFLFDHSQGHAHKKKVHLMTATCLGVLGDCNPICGEQQLSMSALVPLIVSLMLAIANLLFLRQMMTVHGGTHRTRLESQDAMMSPTTIFSKW